MAIEAVCCWVQGYFLVVHTPNPHHTTTVRFSLQGNKASSTQLLIGVLVQFFFISRQITNRHVIVCIPYLVIEVREAIELKLPKICPHLMTKIETSSNW